MKKIISILMMLLGGVLVAQSQAPAIFNYQGVARNSVGNVLVNKNITLRLTVHDGSAAGPVVYQESRAVTTNPFGLFNVQVGSAGATSVTGTIAGVNWGVGNKYIQVEIDPNGGTTFINIGTAQMASVPYAWYTNLAGDLVLPFNKTQADAGTLFKITNSGTGAGSTALEGLTNSTAGSVSAIIGTVTPTAPGGFSTGVRGVNNGTAGLGIGVWGSQNGSGWGVYGQTPSGIGVHGASTSGFGMYGLSTSGTAIYGFSSTGRSGFFENTNAANTSVTLSAASNGTGWAGQFTSTNATTRALRTVGGLQLTGINEGLNRILGSDAIGNATWQTAAGLGLVSGSGTLNFVPKWTPDGVTLGNSQIFDNGVSVGINTATPNATYRLEVAGLQRINATTNQEGGELRFQEGNLFGPQNHWIIDNFQSFAGGNRFRIWNDAGQQAISMMPTGRVAIGPMIFSDQPQNILDVEGNLAVGAGYSGTNAAPVNGAIIEGSVGIGFTAPNAKLRVEQTATTQSAVLVNKTNTTNTDNAMNVVSANSTAVQYGNSAILGQRGTIGANTYLWAGGAGGTAVTGISSTGIGMQGTSENGFGMVALSFNGIGIRGYNLNSGNAARFENDLNVGNAAPVVFVNSIATGGGVFGLHSNMAATSPGGFSTAVRGQHNSTTGNGIGVWGSQAGNGWGVYGTTPTGVGVYGTSSNGTGGVGFGVWGEAFGPFPFAGGVFRGLTGSNYGSYSDNNNPAGWAAALAYQNNVAPTNPGSSAMWGLNLATNGVGYGGQFSHASDGVGVYGVTGLNGTGVYGASTGVTGIGVRGSSNLGFAGLFETSSTTNINATLRVNDPNLTGGSVFRKSGIYSEITPIAGATTILAATSAIKGVATVSTTIGPAGGAGVQGVSRSGYGVVGNTNDGVALMGIAWGATGYALETTGKVMISGQGAALNRVLTSDAVGNATWQDLGAIGGVSGSGTNNYVTKWTPDGSTLGISQIFDNGIAVGIGTTTPTPAVKLDMVGTFSQMRLFDTDQNSQVWISAPGFGYTGGVGTTTNHDFPIFTNFADRMTIKANGRVGVNTTNPQGTMEIFNNSFVGTPHLMLNENGDDYGRLTLRNTNANNSGNNFWDVAGYTNDNRALERLNFYNNASGDLMTITGDGRVGIGINAGYPFTKFHVNSSTDFNTSLLEARDADNVGPHQYYYSGGEYGIVDYIRSDYSIPGFLSRRGALEVRGANRLNLHATNAINYNNGMTLLGNGLVGVGTDNPFYKFHVASNVAVAFVHDLDQSTAVALVAPGLGYTGGAGTFTAQDFPLFTNNIDRVTVKPNGDVGIATATPSARLHLVSRPDDVGVFSSVSHTTAADFTTFRYANVFNSVNTNYGIFSKTGAVMNGNLPPAMTSVFGMDSSNANASNGITGYAVSDVNGTSGVYGFSGRNVSPTVIGYYNANSGGTFIGGDHGVNGLVWNTVPQMQVVGSNANKAGVLAYVNTLAHPGINYGLYVQTVIGGATNYAGYFNGNVQVNGNFSASGAKAFRIDHPLDPANKYLIHAAVESPEMMNMYNGNVVTDATGRATVELPSYFEAANKEFKYQLTIVDEEDFAMARISKKISGNRFEIMTDKPNIEVSWQVTGVRNDVAADKYRFQAETEKTGAERGKYLTPELYGQTEEKGIHYRSSPQVTKPGDTAPLVPVEVKEPEPKNIPTGAMTQDPTDVRDTRESLEKTWMRGKNESMPSRNNSSADGVKPAEPSKPVKLLPEATNVDEKQKASINQKPVSNSSATTPTLPSVTLSEQELRTAQQNKGDNPPVTQKPLQPEKQGTQQPVEKPVENKTVDPGGKIEKPVSKTE